MKQESMKWLEFGFSESRDFSRGEVQNIKWEDAARDFGVELAPGSIGYNVPTSWTSTPVLKDYEFFARTQCGRYLIINGEGKAWLGQPIDYKNTYGKPIFP